MSLETASLLYRRPALYDAVNEPDTAAVARLIAGHRTRPATTVLDIGCATGALLASLPAHYIERVGVDLQPGMIHYASRAHPDLELHAGDARTIRLGRTFDAITCVGLTLAYLHTTDDFDAAIATLAAHAHAGTVIVLQTLTEPIESRGPFDATVSLGNGSARITTTYEWEDPFLVMRRRWCLHPSEIANDHLRRRVWSVQQLRTALAQAGLSPADALEGGYLLATATGQSTTMATGVNTATTSQERSG
jgi:SAM-dependent methyltransferase